MLYASFTSEALSEGGLVVPSLPAITTPKGDAIVVSSMMLLGGFPTTIWRQHLYPVGFDASAACKEQTNVLSYTLSLMSQAATVT